MADKPKAAEPIDREEFDHLFDKAVVLCGGQPDGDGWTEQKKEWWAWFGRVDAPIIRRAFPMMLKALNPDKGERFPLFTRMRYVVDVLLRDARRAAHHATCELCGDHGVVLAVPTGDEWRHADRKTRDPKRFRCVCDAGGRITADLPSVVRILPIRNYDTRMWRGGTLSALTRECLEAGKQGASKEQLNEIAERYLAERAAKVAPQSKETTK